MPKNDLAIKLECVFNIKEHWSVLNFFINKAREAIKKYCGLDELDESYDDVLIELGYYYYKNRHNTGVVQQSQGSRSATFRNEDIPESIKARLPVPKARML